MVRRSASSTPSGNGIGFTAFASPGASARATEAVCPVLGMSKRMATIAVVLMDALLDGMAHCPDTGRWGLLYLNAVKDRPEVVCRSGHDLLDHMPVHVRQPPVNAVVAER